MINADSMKQPNTYFATAKDFRIRDTETHIPNFRTLKDLNSGPP